MPIHEKWYIKSAHAGLAQAEEERARGQHAKAEWLYTASLCQLLSVAVNNYTSPDGGIAFLHNERATDFIASCADETAVTLERIRAGTEYESVLTGDYDLIVLTHLSWLLDADELGKSFLGILVNQGKVREHGILKFWHDYGRGMVAVVDHEPYEPAQLKLKNWQKHVDCYRELMRAITHGNDLTEHLRRVRLIFEKRNRDKRFSDPPRIDGDGHFPVRWDFRRESLLRFMHRHYG